MINSSFHLILDIMGAALAICATCLMIRECIACWYVSIFSSLTNATLAWVYQLHAVAVLHIYFLFASVYSLVRWRSLIRHHYTIRWSSSRFILRCILVTCMAAFCLAIISVQHHANLLATESSLPLAFSMAGIYLSANKRIECWLFWFVADAINIHIYLALSLPFHVMLYVAYIILAFKGFIEWQRKIPEVEVQIA